MKTIDLRSDTVTLPSPSMREAIYRADLGDDVFGEDRTTNRLERMAADRMGKEAALLVPSGTMGNLACVLTHCGRGDEVILGNLSHTFVYEAGGIAALGGVHPRTLANEPDGTILPEDIEAAIRSDNIHFPRSRLICLENTHNLCNGSPLSAAYIDSVKSIARRNNLSVHMDGARIFNAAVALGTSVKELTRSVDSLTFCLSKGLSAPVGSIICGSESFIAGARRTRKILGGGMRQCGIIAAAGIVALEEMVDQIADDHRNAHRLALDIAGIPGLSIDPESVKTNIVYFYLEKGGINADELMKRIDEHGVKIMHMGNGRFRMVTHYGITAEDIDIASATLTSIMKAW